jgi:hypothetical protein
MEGVLTSKRLVVGRLAATASTRFRFLPLSRDGKQSLTYVGRMDDALCFDLGIGDRFHTQTILFLNHPPSKLIHPTHLQLQAISFIKQANPYPFIAHTFNTMKSTLPSLSFQSPCFKIQPATQQSLWPPRRQSTRKPGLPLKLIRAALGPDANGGLLNADRRGATLPSSPLSDVVQEFYSSLNEKNSKRLDKLMAPDCIIEDTAYYKPLDAKVNFSPASAFQSPM